MENVEIRFLLKEVDVILSKPKSHISSLALSSMQNFFAIHSEYYQLRILIGYTSDTSLDSFSQGVSLSGCDCIGC